MEFRKGILFVRLSGVLNDSNCYQLVNKLEDLINYNKVRFVTFNVSDLTSIDNIGIDLILKYEEDLQKINGKILICGIKNDLVRLKINNSRVPHHIFETNDELGAINYITLGGYL